MNKCLISAESIVMKVTGFFLSHPELYFSFHNDQIFHTAISCKLYQ